MSAERRTRRALGRGIEALLPTRPAARSPSQRADAVFSCPIERLEPRQDQPRQGFDGDRLDELAATIKAVGIIQPIVARRVAEDRYEIIAGERRWRAAQRAGLKDVPVVVKDVSTELTFELALIENLQREDLNPIEVAIAYERLIDDHSHTQEQLAERVGKSRSAVTNALRLLKLPTRVRTMVSDGTLSEGHGRALLGAPDEATLLRLANKTARGRLSVRKVEQLIRSAKRPARPSVEPAQKSASVRDLEQRLTRRLGARVVVEHKGPGGKLSVSYADLDELDRILKVIDA